VCNVRPFHPVCSPTSLQVPRSNCGAAAGGQVRRPSAQHLPPIASLPPLAHDARCQVRRGVCRLQREAEHGQRACPGAEERAGGVFPSLAPRAICDASRLPVIRSLSAYSRRRRGRSRRASRGRRGEMTAGATGEAMIIETAGGARSTGTAEAVARGGAAAALPSPSKSRSERERGRRLCRWACCARAACACPAVANAFCRSVRTTPTSAPLPTRRRS
jgi:hypothetical protein